MKEGLFYFLISGKDMSLISSLFVFDFMILKVFGSIIFFRHHHFKEFFIVYKAILVLIDLAY